MITKRKIAILMVAVLVLTAMPFVAPRQVKAEDWDGTLHNTEFIVSYDAQRSTVSAKVNGTEYTDFSTPITFATGDAISFKVSGEVYKVVVYPSEGADTVLEPQAGQEYPYTYTPETTLGFEVRIYPTQSAYEFDACQPNRENGEFSVEYEIRYDGITEQNLVQISSISEEQGRVVNGDRTKLILTGSAVTITFSITTEAGIEYRVWKNGEDETGEVSDGKYVWTVVNNDWNELQIAFFPEGDNPGGGTEDPNQFSGIKLDNNKGTTVTYQLGDKGTTGTLNNGDCIPTNDLSSVDKVIFSITPENVSQKVTGVRIWYNDGSDHISYQKLDNNKQFTLEKGSEGWKNYLIEVIDYDAIFDNEYRINYVSSSDSASIQVNGSTVSNLSNVQTFESGTAYSFVPSGTVAKAFVHPVEGNDFDLSLQNGAYTYTPQNNLGFEIWFFETQEAYDYEMCQPDWENGEFSVEYEARSLEQNDTSSVSATSVSGGTINKQVTYGSRTKLILSNDVNQISLTITPAEGMKYQVFVRGDQDVTSDVSDHVYSWSAENGHWDPVEIVFSKNGNAGGETGGEGGSGEGGTGEGGTGEGGNGNQDPSVYTKEKCVRDVKDHEYAYYVNLDSLSKDEAKAKIYTYLETELYYEFFSESNPDRPYGWIFDNRDAMRDAVTISAISTASDDAIGLRYYDYTVDLGEEYKASGKVYVLESKDQFIVKTGSTYHVVEVSYYYKTSPDDPNRQDRFAYDVYVQGDRDVKIFGNGTCMAGQLDSASPNVMGGHITQEHSGLDRQDENNDLSGLGCRLVVCQSGFQGTKITGDRDAAAWNFFNLGMYDVSSSQNSPTVADVYYGSSALTISSKVTYTDTQTSGKVISGVAVDTTKLTASAVTIVTNADNNFELTIHTAYDEIPLILTYTDNSKGYVNLHRVGLAIDKTDIKDSKYDAWHGTDHTVRYTESNTANGKAVYASFYYAGNTRPENAVSLFATITKADGSIEKKLISSPITMTGQYVEWNGSVASNASDKLGVASQGSDKYYDDFLIWSGSENDFRDITKVEVIVYTPGSADTFGGVKIGSGNGVVWENK